MLDPDACHRALTARDPRFDGLFFVGVSSTGIYCRPVCPARTPAPDRCSYFPHAAAAEAAGFRACLRCRPERAPGNAPSDATDRLVRRAVARIEAGALDRGSVDELAAALGVSGRHLRRALEDALGTTPLALARARRLATARQLLRDTSVPVADIASLAGFGSVRAMNEAFRVHAGRTPSELRGDRADGPLRVTLAARPPYDGPEVLRFLAARALRGVEQVEGDTWSRTATVGGRTGTVSARVDGHEVRVSLSPSLAPVLVQVVARLRRLFDLDAHPDRIAAVLADDPIVGPSVRARPGLRVPGAFEPFEVAVRAVLGQQVTVAAATTVAGRLVAHFGEFPSPERLAAATVGELAGLGMPGKRAETLRALGRAVADGVVDFEDDPADVERAMVALPGIGPWTASVVVMRALAWPDAFPAGDLGVKRALGVTSEAAATAIAEAWRPWRSYAVLHLWRGAT